MKKILFLFTMLASITASAQRTTPVTIANTKVDYSTTKTVTFDLSWKGSDATHRDEVWVFVNIQPITGANTLGSWSPATLVPSATTITGGSGNQYSSLTYTEVSGNTRGLWVKGTASNTTSIFAATVKVTLANGTPEKFNSCAYATDYPPNATSYNSGTYTLKGTQAFIITGNGTIQDGDQYVGTVINSLTDATGCPGGVGRDQPHNGGTCAPGLTAVGDYCRDLKDDDAFVFTCLGNTIEVKNSDAGMPTWNTRDLCTSIGWRITTGQELECMCKAEVLTAPKTYMPADMSYYTTTCIGNDYPYTAIFVYTTNVQCIRSLYNKCDVVFYRGLYGGDNVNAYVRCAR
ncbi:MAG: hypothetical protein LBU42_08730 [Prevotellaceae bacterium]|jgi:hypothetical protein|nr:hypothetical protein [Prevotellaceae bacterium]